MDILDRISLLLGTREQQELTAYLGLKNSAFSDWKSGKSHSFRKYLIEISEFFDVSIDYLVYGKKNYSSSTLSEQENQCLEAFNNLTTEDKISFIARMKQRYEDYEIEIQKEVKRA